MSHLNIFYINLDYKIIWMICYFQSLTSYSLVDKLIFEVMSNEVLNGIRKIDSIKTTQPQQYI